MIKKLLSRFKLKETDEPGGYLFHLSQKKIGDNVTLNPKVPNNFMTKNGYENNTIQRTSLSNSIYGACAGLSMNLKDKVLYVYLPGAIDHHKILEPEELMLNKYVPDAFLVNEFWYTDKLNMDYIGKIKVIDSYDEEFVYKYGEDKTASLYFWKYDILDNPKGIIPEDTEERFKAYVASLKI